MNWNEFIHKCFYFNIETSLLQFYTSADTTGEDNFIT